MLEITFIDQTRHKRYINLQFLHKDETIKNDLKGKYNLSVQPLVPFFVPEDYVPTVDLYTFYLWTVWGYYTNLQIAIYDCPLDSSSHFPFFFFYSRLLSLSDGSEQVLCSMLCYTSFSSVTNETVKISSNLFKMFLFSWLWMKCLHVVRMSLPLDYIPSKSIVSTFPYPTYLKTI